MRTIERRVVLAVMDRKWREHLYEMDYLKDGIGLRGMGQRDPLVEYQREGYQMYNSMVDSIKEEVVQLLFNIDLELIAREAEENEAVENQEVPEESLSYSAPTEDATSDEEIEEDEDSEDTESSERVSHSYEGHVTGAAPISHAEGKVPASKRPKSEELHSPWSDGRVFEGTPKNAPCPCGSGRKYKMCHGKNEK